MALFQDCIDIGENLANLIENLLTGLDTETFEGIPSLRKVVKDNKDKSGSVWNSTPTYNNGDIVSYLEKFYFAKQSSINKQPDIETDYWEEKVYTTIAGAEGIEFALLFDNVGNISRGGDYVQSIVRIGAGHFRVNFINNFADTDYISIVNCWIGTDINWDRFRMTIVDKNVAYMEFKTYNCANEGAEEDALEYNISFIS